MSKYWLKMIGTAESRCPDVWTENHVYFRKAKPTTIHAGDRMILYAVGRRKRVFAVAVVTSEAYENSHTQWRYQMNVDYVINLPVKSGVSIDSIHTERNLVGSIQHGSSYIELLPQEYEQAEALLRAAAPPADTMRDLRTLTN